MLIINCIRTASDIVYLGLSIRFYKSKYYLCVNKAYLYIISNEHYLQIIYDGDNISIIAGNNIFSGWRFHIPWPVYNHIVSNIIRESDDDTFPFRQQEMIIPGLHWCILSPNVDRISIDRLKHTIQKIDF